ncbi:sensor histidine kinase [Vibrio sp. HN007]|uniref:sensor histidine kinase n=1 Tax=Vibrio iocasae TaxID=3098914 RepID=UPI0035D49453
MVDVNNSSKSGRWMKSLVVTTVVCAVIAAFTRSIWSGPYYQHLLISLGFGYSSMLSSYLFRQFLPNLTSLTNSLLSICCAVGIGTAHAHFWLSTYEGYEAKDGLLSVLILGVVFTALCFNYFYHLERKLVAEAELEKVKRKETEKEKALVLSQLSQLQSQIEPHFLFNTLANISALIESDTKKAQLMINKLTDLLRANLKSTREALTTVEAEIEMLNAYLGIQQVRLGERLEFRIVCDESIKSMSVPPLLIQPLVENSINHGIEPKPEGGNVEVEFHLEADYLNVNVSDSGRGFSEHGQKGHGIGLENIRNRLEMLFETKAKLIIKEKASGGVEARISLPVQDLEALNPHTQRIDS